MSTTAIETPVGGSSYGQAETGAPIDSVFTARRRGDRRGTFDRRRLDVGPPHGGDDRRQGERRAHQRVREEPHPRTAAFAAEEEDVTAHFGFRLFKRRSDPAKAAPENRDQVEAQLERVLRLSSAK